jgi:hypothetical protein
MDLAQQILNQVKSKGQKPKPRIWFIGVHFLWYTALLLTMLLGSQAWGLTLQSLWPNEDLPGQGFIHLALGLLPWIWLGFGIVSTLLGILFYRKLRYGYRNSLAKILGILLGCSLGLGGLSFSLDLSWKAHKFMVHTIPIYGSLFEHQRHLYWTAPDEGRLAGEWINPDQIRDYQGTLWQIHFNQRPDSILLGQWIRLNGIKCNQGFCVDQIKVWNSTRQHKSCKSPPQSPTKQ